MAKKEEILRFVKEKAPVIPNHIKKVLGGETYMISALLSELASDGLIKISHTKIGGSPTYFLPGQEFKLLNLKKYLNQKDQTTLELLKQKKVLRDKKQEMLIRVSLRKIRDFAKPLEVNVRGEKEIFWKWFLTTSDDAELMIRRLLTGKLMSETAVEEKKPFAEGKKQEKTKYVKKDEGKKPPNDMQGEFLEQLQKYLNKNNIEILKEEIIRKKSDIEFQLRIPSAIGKVEYFCKAKNKKKCNDGDLSSAYLKGQSLKLPVLFITTGEVTKKATDMLNNEFKGLILKQL